MKSYFSFNSKYRTDLTSQEVFVAIDQLLGRKSRFLFFFAHQYFGTVTDSEFTLTRQRFDWWGIMSSRLKGRILNDNGTVVQTKVTIPWAIVTIFCFIIPTTLFSVITADEMTVNGEVTRADFFSKVMVASLVIAFPACMIFAISILPTKLMERKLIELLKLKEYRDDPHGV
jgi:hypothetical protein